MSRNNILIALTSLMVLFGTAIAVHGQSLDNGVYTAPESLSSTAPSIYWESVDPTEWDHGEVGFVYFFNRVEHRLDEETITLDTAYGQIIGTLITTPNNACQSHTGSQLCPDVLTLYQWPDGFSIHPVQLIVDENTMGFITLYKLDGV